MSILGFAALWLVWIVAYYAVKNELLFPSLGDTFSALSKLTFTGGAVARAFWRAFGFTLLRTLLAFVISFACGALLAALAVTYRGVRAFFAPVVSILRTFPTLAVVLFLLLWTTPFFAPVVVAALVLFPAVYAAALVSFSTAVKKFGDFAKVYQIGKAKRIFKLYLPASLPALISEGGAALSMGLKITVSGEVLAASFQSLGGMMQEAQIYLATPRLFALTLVTVLSGFLLEGLCALLKRLCVKWDRGESV